jgi:glutathione S-transferase
MDAAEVIDSIHVFDRMLGEMEATLGGAPWLAGPRLSIADLKLLPYVLRLDHLDLAWMWDERPGVADWFARIQARPSYGPAIVEVIPQNEIDVLKTGGRERPKIEAILERPAA